MILPQTYTATLLFLVLSMLCWGSWASLYKLTRTWRFELFYFDYALGVLVAAVVLGFTAGSLGTDGFTFTDSLMSAGKRQMLFALLGGILFNLANMLLVAAIAVAGMAVAFPIVMGTAVIIGVLLNYTVQASGSPMLLFAGCAAIVAAIVVDAMAYRARGLVRYEQKARAGTVSTRKRAPVKGIVVGLVSGVLMGLFYPMLSKSQTADQVTVFTPYAVGFVFALGVFLTTPLFNMFFMNLPVEGEPVEFPAFLRGSLKQHFLGWLGGALWCVGMLANFTAANATTATGQPLVAASTSYALGQGATIVAALWGILAWKEFKGADSRIKALVLLMLVLFVFGLAMVSVAPEFGPKVA